jgi:hypothetical protein
VFSSGDVLFDYAPDLRLGFGMASRARSTDSHGLSFKTRNRRRGLTRSEWSLFLAAKTSGNIAQQLVLLLPPRLERPGEDLLKLIAVIDGSMKKNNIGAVFGPG